MMWRLIGLFLIISGTVVAQNKPLLFNVDDLPQTLMSNPGAQINFTGHNAGKHLPNKVGYSTRTSRQFASRNFINKYLYLDMF